MQEIIHVASGKGNGICSKGVVSAPPNNSPCELTSILAAADSGTLNGPCNIQVHVYGLQDNKMLLEMPSPPPQSSSIVQSSTRWSFLCKYKMQYMQIRRQNGCYTILVDKCGKPMANKQELHCALMDVAGRILDINEIDFSKHTNLA